MTEWDKLWEKFDCSKAPESWYAKVKAVGDKLQEENKQLRTRISEYFFTTKEQEQKLEAIREIANRWRTQYEQSQSWEIQEITSEILEVLGDES